MDPNGAMIKISGSGYDEEFNKLAQEWKSKGIDFHSVSIPSQEETVVEFYVNGQEIKTLEGWDEEEIVRTLQAMSSETVIDIPALVCDHGETDGICLCGVDMEVLCEN